MSQLQVRNIAKEFGELELLKGVSFDLEYGERVGLVGDNGCGKSTLLQILAGVQEADAGGLLLQSGQRVGYLRQDAEAETEIEPAHYPAVLRQLGEMSAQKELLTRPTHTLSGGERIKLALARILAQDPDLLLLDEPTNNLDVDGIAALLETLYSYPGTILVVSHDRYFLDRLTLRILELEGGIIREYPGNYSDYREEKARLFLEQLRHWQEDKRKQEQVNQAIRRLRGFAEKSHRLSTQKDSCGNMDGFKEYGRKQAKQTDKRVKSQMKRLERMQKEAEPRPREEAKVRFEVNGSGVSRGKRILEARSLCGGYEGRALFSNVDFVLMRGEHAALFGPNGCGKTTFVRLLTGELAPLSGELWHSPSSRPCVLSQSILALPREKTAMEHFRSRLGTLNGDQRTQLACMGLNTELLNRKLATLSLGEQMKVKLAELIFAHEDFLILDEPTNYLDLHARETLEDTLSVFEGTLLVISHDLYFLERVCNQTFAFQEGSIKRTELPFADYIERIR